MLGKPKRAWIETRYPRDETPVSRVNRYFIPTVSKTVAHPTQPLKHYGSTQQHTMQAFRTLPRRAAALRAFSTTAPRPLAKMQLIGRLADTPEHQDTSTGRDIVRFALGVSTGPKDESGNRGVSWFRVASFLNDGPQKDLLLSQVKG